jgi:hypothetical protein
MTTFSPWDTIPNQIVDTIEAQAHGTYQQALLDGGASWSGASLKGKAREYSGSYARSRGNLLTRISKALPEGWTATTRLVPIQCHNRQGEPIGTRPCRELVVTGPTGSWIYGQYHS